MPVGVACLLGAWVTVSVDVRVHRKFGSREQTIAYQRALRTGERTACLVDGGSGAAGRPAVLGMTQAGMLDLVDFGVTAVPPFPDRTHLP
jgi:hypothetical protein